MPEGFAFPLSNRFWVPLRADPSDYERRQGPGVLAALLLDRLVEGDFMGGQEAVLLPAVAALMTAVGLLAALGPARRGLRVQPTEALKEQ
jgi:hypothetical protein